MGVVALDVMGGVSAGTSGERIERIEWGERVAIVLVEEVRSDPVIASMMRQFYALFGLSRPFFLTRSQARAFEELRMRFVRE